MKRRKLGGLPDVKTETKMPPVNPPKGGSGVPNKKSEKRKDMFAKAKMLDALTTLYDVNSRRGVLRDREIESEVKSKIRKLLYDM